MTSKPSICHVLHSLGVGGAEVLAFRLGRQLTDRYRFVFACLDDLGTLGQQLRAEGFRVQVLGRGEGLDPGCMLRLGRFLRDERVDLVHAHQYTPFFYSLAARHLHRRPAVLFTEHGRTHPDFPRPKRMIFNRTMLRSKDRVVAVGEAVRQALIDNEGLPGGRLEVIYNGVDVSSFVADTGSAAGARQELEVSPETLVIVQVARLDRLKDHLTAVQTLYEVRRNGVDACLVLVGEGDQLSLIQKEVSRLGVGDRVRFLGLRRDIARLLSASDVFLLTSISEGIPVTLIEAMLAGLPVVSTDVGGVREVVVAEETGVLCPAKDSIALARAIQRLAENAELRRRMGLAGRSRAESRFGETRMHAAYALRYDQMLLD